MLGGKNRRVVFFDLESPKDRRRLQNPETVLSAQKGLVILDEIQNQPELINVLRVVADQQSNKARFVILGSASPQLIKGVSESLAGRVEFVDLAGFDLSEVGAASWETLWLRGGFPRSYLAAKNDDSLAWREGFIRTFLERDLPQLGISIPAATMRRFWTMLAHFHGQTWNSSVLARSMGLSDKTIRSYLDILTGAYVVRQLQPWYENIKKRQVKAPKVYLIDSGLMHSLLSIDEMADLQANPKVGASWEGFVIEQFARIVHPKELYFWSTHSGLEVDLIFFSQGKKYGVEIKINEAPTVSKSMRNSVAELQLEHLWVLYPGDEPFSMAKKISAWPLVKMCEFPLGSVK